MNPASRGSAGVLAGVDAALARLVEALVATLVVVEIAVLSAGVVARYALGKPLLWSDELALLLFAWLAMLGAVVALRRGEHMRLSFLVDRFPLIWQRRVDGLVTSAMIAFLLGVLPSAIRYANIQLLEITTALRVPVAFRVAAVAVSFLLMALTLIVRLTSRNDWRDILAFAALLTLSAVAGWAARPLLDAIGDYSLILFFIVLVLSLVLVGMPIAFAFGISTVSYLVLMTHVPLTILSNRLDGGISDLILLSIPMFIFLGSAIEATGLALALIDCMVALLGHLRGGLHYVLLSGMYLVSGISGSKTADMAAVVPILFPEMKRRGAREGDLIALLSASGAMAETIPPSIILISIGVVTGVSISDLFKGGLLPAAVGALALAAVIRVRTRRDPAPRSAGPGGRVVMRRLVVALPALALPVLIRTAVVNGVATATEVATVGILYSFVCGAVLYRRWPGRALYPMLVKTASLSGSLLLIIGLANALAWALTRAGFAGRVEDVMTNIPGGQVGFLGVSIVLFAVLGSLLEGFPAIVLVGPLLFPIAQQLGIDQVQYAMVAVLAMSLGLFSPPFGVGFYGACIVGGVSPDKAMREIWIYMGALLAAVVVIAGVPWLSNGFL